MLFDYFCFRHGVMHCKSVPQGETVIVEFYWNALRRLGGERWVETASSVCQPAISSQRRALWKRRWFLATRTQSLITICPTSHICLLQHCPLLENETEGSLFWQTAAPHISTSANGRNKTSTDRSKRSSCGKNSRERYEQSFRSSHAPKSCLIKL